jgi:hypothetical protein
MSSSSSRLALKIQMTERCDVFVDMLSTQLLPIEKIDDRANLEGAGAAKFSSTSNVIRLDFVAKYYVKLAVKFVAHGKHCSYRSLVKKRHSTCCPAHMLSNICERYVDTPGVDQPTQMEIARVHEVRSQPCMSRVRQ